MSRRASLQCSNLYVAHPTDNILNPNRKNFRQDSQSSLRSLSNEPGLKLPQIPPPIPPRPRSSPHRSSQPTLILRANDIPLPPPLRHVPSQPIIMYTPKQGSPIRQFPLVSDNGPTSPFNLNPNQPSNHFYTTNSNPNSKTSSPTVGRKLPKASEKRILKRCPQSDLAFRFQKHMNAAENGHALDGIQKKEEGGFCANFCKI